MWNDERRRRLTLKQASKQQPHAQPTRVPWFDKVTCCPANDVLGVYDVAAFNSSPAVLISTLLKTTATSALNLVRLRVISTCSLNIQLAILCLIPLHQLIKTTKMNYQRVLTMMTTTMKKTTPTSTTKTMTKTHIYSYLNPPNPSPHSRLPHIHKTHGRK